MHLVAGTEVEFVMCAILTEIPIRVKLIGNRACRPDAFFLMGD